MIVTNEAVANYMLDLGLTFIYRNHEIPFKDKIKDAFQIIKDIGCRFEAGKMSKTLMSSKKLFKV